MAFVKARKLIHNYIKRNEQGEVSEILTAVKGVDLDVQQGSFVAILGHNGSGKSTLAKHINGILMPTEGTLWVDGKDVTAEENLLAIRQAAGMVFQNPDNQIIAGVVEEDVGFGPENLGVPTEEIWNRVEHSLGAVDMLDYRKHSPNKLSGGQKQRVAIAGVVAMEPKCIVLDEPTAMLDPHGRQEVMKTIQALNREKGVTIILITHYMEEVVDADQIFVMDDGQIVMQGTPTEIFARIEELQSYRMDVPQVTMLAYELRKNGLQLSNPILYREQLKNELCKLLHPTEERSTEENERSEGKKSGQETVLRLEQLNYVYAKGTAYEIHALKDVTLKIARGSFVGLIGHTGSGKSTLIQHLDGLERATSGQIYFTPKGGSEENIYAEGYSMRQLRGKVGLVFQYPEYQLFETDVLKDVCFGPKNQGCSEEEAVQRAKEALTAVGLEERYWDNSPFELSGGQKRRAAIAGVLAMNPEVLILDEPTAGLDPKGRDEILEQVAALRREKGITVILVSHSMEDVANYADRLVVMNRGSVILDGPPREVFGHLEELESAHLAAPQVTYLMRDLAEEGLPVNTGVTTITEAKDEILRLC